MNRYERILGGLFGVAYGTLLVELWNLCQSMKLKGNMDI